MSAPHGTAARMTVSGRFQRKSRGLQPARPQTSECGVLSNGKTARAEARGSDANRRRRRGQRHLLGAFTLLELLVVIGVIALLLAVLMPALGRPRDEARGIHCAAMLHNAGTAMTLYHEDNDGAFWPYYVDVSSGEPGRRWWFGFEPGGPAAGGSQGNRYIDRRSGFLGLYLTGTAADFRCPAFPYNGGRYFEKFSPRAGGYGYNTGALAGFSPLDPAGPRTRRISEFDGRTSDVFALADGIHFDRLDHSSSPPLDQTFNEPAYIQWQNPSFFGRNVGVNGGYGHFRHNGRAMVLYLDAHVAGQPPRRPLHPYSTRGYGPVANLSDDMLRVREFTRGSHTLLIDLIYGLE